MEHLFHRLRLTPIPLSSEVPPTPRQPTAMLSHNQHHQHHHHTVTAHHSAPSAFTTATASTSNQPTASSSNPSQTDSRWISSLRRRDPEIQPTLPSINHHLSGGSSGGVAFSIANSDKRGRSSKVSSGVRKSRSVERFRARKVGSKTKLSL